MSREPRLKRRVGGAARAETALVRATPIAPAPCTSNLLSVTVIADQKELVIEKLQEFGFHIRRPGDASTRITANRLLAAGYLGHELQQRGRPVTNVGEMVWIAQLEHDLAGECLVCPMGEKEINAWFARVKTRDDEMAERVLASVPAFGAMLLPLGLGRSILGITAETDTLISLLETLLPKWEAIYFKGGGVRTDLGFALEYLRTESKR